MWGFRVEPAGVAEAIRQILFMVVLFGLVSWTDAQQAAVLSVVSAVLSLFVRQNVTTAKTLQQAGVTQDQVARVADNPAQVLTVSSVR